MGILDEVKTGCKKYPRRILLYGPSGIGKTTFATQSPRPIVADVEGSTKNIDCHRVLIKSLEDFRQLIDDLISEDHDYLSFVLDTADWLQKLISPLALDRYNAANPMAKSSHIGDVGYQRGWTNYVLPIWEKILHSLAALQDQKGLFVIIVAHTGKRSVKDPRYPDYDQLKPDLNNCVSNLLVGWSEDVLFATQDATVVKEEGDFGSERGRVKPIGERVAYLSESLAFEAKNRLGKDTPKKIPLDWKIYENFFSDQGYLINYLGKSKKKEGEKNG